MYVGREFPLFCECVHVYICVCIYSYIYLSIYIVSERGMIFSAMLTELLILRCKSCISLFAGPFQLPLRNWRGIQTVCRHFTFSNLFWEKWYPGLNFDLKWNAAGLSQLLVVIAPQCKHRTVQPIQCSLFSVEDDPALPHLAFILQLNLYVCILLKKESGAYTVGWVGQGIQRKKHCK